MVSLAMGKYSEVYCFSICFIPPVWNYKIQSCSKAVQQTAIGNEARHADISIRLYSKIVNDFVHVIRYRMEKKETTKLGRHDYVYWAEDSSRKWH